MGAHESLGPQFMDHDTLGALKTSDYAGHVRDGVPAMESWQSKFGGTTEAREYDPGDGPAQSVERMRADIRANGIQKPITVIDYESHRSIKDGHHRAVAAHMEGQGAPVEVITSDEYVKRLYRGR